MGKLAGEGTQPEPLAEFANHLAPGMGALLLLLDAQVKYAFVVRPYHMR